MNMDAVTHGTEMTVTARSNFKAGEVKLDDQCICATRCRCILPADLQSANLNPLLEAFLPLRMGLPPN